MSIKYMPSNSISIRSNPEAFKTSASDKPAIELNCRWTILFRTHVEFKFNGKDFGGTANALGFSNNLIGACCKLVFEGNQKSHIEFWENHHLIGLNVTDDNSCIEVSIFEGVKEMNSEMPSDTISLNLLEFTRLVFEFHSKQIYLAITAMPSLKLDKDFLQNCLFAKKILGMS